jgi:hypothetical protein
VAWSGTVDLATNSIAFPVTILMAGLTTSLHSLAKRNIIIGHIINNHIEDDNG